MASAESLTVGLPLRQQNDLIPLFSHYGYIVEIRMQADRGFAFVKLDTHENAASAIVNLAGQIACGRPIKCGWGKDRNESTMLAGALRQGLHINGYGNPVSARRQQHGVPVPWFLVALAWLTNNVCKCRLRRRPCMACHSTAFPPLDSPTPRAQRRSTPRPCSRCKPLKRRPYMHMLKLKLNKHSWRSNQCSTSNSSSSTNPSNSSGTRLIILPQPPC